VRPRALYYTLCFWLIAVAAIACCEVAFGQIVVPAESEPYKLIVAKLATPIPEGAYLADGGFEVLGATATARADVREYGGEIVWTGSPGVYQVVFDGVILKNVTFTDGSGKEITIVSYLGRIKAKATCVIKGGTPPVPPPPGKRRAVILEESLLRTIPQALLYDQVRIKFGNKVPVWDDDQPGAQSYVKLSKSGYRPVLLVLAEDGQLVREVALPASVEAIEQEINR
jgi:hypothetical protein